MGKERFLNGFYFGILHVSTFFIYLEWLWNGFGMGLEWFWNGFGMVLELSWNCLELSYLIVFVKKLFFLFFCD